MAVRWYGFEYSDRFVKTAQQAQQLPLLDHVPWMYLAIPKHV
jgi:hypothetical protein